MKTLALTVLVFAACSKPNPYYCEDHPDHNCLIDSAGSDTGSGNCTIVGCATGVCDPAKTTCVQCTADQHAACTGTTPVCSANDTCEPCSNDTGCTLSNTCLPDGSCADPAGVIYASATGSSTALCSQVDPCSLDHALSLVDGTHKIVKLAPGTYANEALLLTQDVTLVGAMAIIDRGSAGPVVSVGNGAKVSLDFVTIQTGVGAAGHGIACTTGALALHGVVVQNNGGNGINSSACDVTVERSTFYRNDQGGIYLGGTSAIKFDITNTFITRNGNNIDAIFGGLYILPTSVASGRLEFNTIADNDASTGVTHYGGVTCDISAVPAANNIVVRNRKANSATGQQTQGACGFVTSIVQDDVTGLAFMNPDSVPYNYRIGATSTAKDQATTASTIEVDVDNHHRPQGAQKDIGASEVMP